MNTQKVDYQTVLANWSVPSEQAKADFLDKLYDFYCVEDGLYTGLWQRYQSDLADFGRFLVEFHGAKIEDLFFVGLK